MNKNEKAIVRTVFEALVKKSYSELNGFLGSETIKNMQKLYSKLKYEDYCKKHKIKFQNMTDDDYMDAFEEECIKNRELAEEDF